MLAKTLGPRGREASPSPRGTAEIRRWSVALRRRILAAPREAGRIHSIFKRALNILWHDGGLISLHGPGPLAAPFAAALASLPEAASLTVGSEVFRRDNRIHLGSLILDGESAMLVDTRLYPTTEKPGLPFASAIATAVAKVVPGLSSYRSRTARRQLADGIASGDARTFVTGACGLIGLGEGLTPAGDDCLVGALAVLHRFASPWLADHPEIRTEIATALQDGTTAVGQNFILHALEGAFSEYILRLVTASSDCDLHQAVRALAETGGTSGLDTLDGMHITLEALLP